MKMQDMGMKRKEAMGMPTESEKNKIIYPSFSVEKDMGMKMGQKVMMEGIVSGIRKDKYGNSTSFEVHKCGMVGKMSDEDFEKMSSEKQEEHIEKQKPK